MCAWADNKEALPGLAASVRDTSSASKRGRQEEATDADGDGQSLAKRSKPSPAKGGKPAKGKGPLDSFFIKNPA